MTSGEEGHTLAFGKVALVAINGQESFCCSCQDDAVAGMGDAAHLLEFFLGITLQLIPMVEEPHLSVAVRKMVGGHHVHSAPIGCYPDISLAVLVDVVDFICRQRVFVCIVVLVVGDGFAVRRNHKQAVAFSAHPYPMLTVLKECIDMLGVQGEPTPKGGSILVFVLVFVEKYKISIIASCPYCSVVSGKERTHLHTFLDEGLLQRVVIETHKRQSHRRPVPDVSLLVDEVLADGVVGDILLCLRCARLFFHIERREISAAELVCPIAHHTLVGNDPLMAFCIHRHLMNQRAFERLSFLSPHLVVVDIERLFVVDTQAEQPLFIGYPRMPVG